MEREKERLNSLRIQREIKFWTKCKCTNDGNVRYCAQLDVRVTEPDGRSFNEWEDSDGCALEKMLQQLDRIVGRGRGIAENHSCVPKSTAIAQVSRADAEKESEGDGVAGGGKSRWGYSGMRHGFRALKRRLQGKK